MPADFQEALILLGHQLERFVIDLTLYLLGLVDRIRTSTQHT